MNFKAKVALEALRGELTTAQLATKHGILQTMVGEWKKQAMEGLLAVFSDRLGGAGNGWVSEVEVEKLSGGGRSSTSNTLSCRLFANAIEYQSAGPGSTTGLPNQNPDA